MKPRWYFAVGSLLLFTSLVVILTEVIFLTNIIIFMVRRMGSVNLWRLDIIISSIPFWIPLLTVSGVVIGTYLLKRYDFSYRKNFSHILILTIIAIFIASWSIDRLGLNQTWSARAPMRNFYQQLDKPLHQFQPSGPGRGAGSVRGAHRHAIFN